MRFNVAQPVIILAVGIALAGCSIPFTVDTPKETIELPSTAGAYVETEVEIPAEARRDGVSFDRVTLSYTIRRDGLFPVDVALYASSDTTADHLQGDAEKLFEERIATGENDVSGTATSDAIVTALNSAQDRFVMGAKNLSVPTDTVYVDVYVTVAGSYAPF